MREKIIKAMFEGNLLRKAIRFVFVKIPDFFIRKLDGLCGRITRFLYCACAPIDTNKIVFMTYNNDYSCNPKYIAEEIIRQELPWDLVWAVPSKGSMYSSHFPERIRRVRRDSYAAYKEVATAKVWVDNSLNFLWKAGITKKTNQVYIETWHGSMGIKRVGKDDVKNKKWVKTAKKCGKITSYCVSNSAFENEVYRTTHWPTTPIWLYGHPRNDVLFRTECISEAKQKVMDTYGLTGDDKYILYAPTFRESGHMDCYSIDYEALVEALEQRFGGTWKVLLRLHFHDRKTKLKEVFPECVVNVTAYSDMQELMMAADAGITDYSSWAYDYVLMRRPLFIFATDLAEYNTERGLYYPLETTPFPIAMNNEELINKIVEFDNLRYQDRIDEFLSEKGCVEDGHAAERVVEKLKEIIGES